MSDREQIFLKIDESLALESIIKVENPEFQTFICESEENIDLLWKSEIFPFS